MQKKLISKLINLTVILIIGSVILLILQVLGGDVFSPGCKLRYPDKKDDERHKEVVLYAVARADLEQCNRDNSCDDDTKYGKWTKVQMDIPKSIKIDFDITGEVSLCKATYNGTPVPRADGISSGGLPFILDPSKFNLDPKSNQFELVNVSLGDKIQLRVGKNTPEEHVMVPDFAAGTPSIKPADCREGINVVNDNRPRVGDAKDQIGFSPLCNRFSPYVDSYYVTGYDGLTAQNAYYYKSGSFYAGYSRLSGWHKSECPLEDARCTCKKFLFEMQSSGHGDGNQHFTGSYAGLCAKKQGVKLLTYPYIPDRVYTDNKFLDKNPVSTSILECYAKGRKNRNEIIPSSDIKNKITKTNPLEDEYVDIPKADTRDSFYEYKGNPAWAPINVNLYYLYFEGQKHKRSPKDINIGDYCKMTAVKPAVSELDYKTWFAFEVDGKPKNSGLSWYVHNNSTLKDTATTDLKITTQSADVGGLNKPRTFDDRIIFDQRIQGVPDQNKDLENNYLTVKFEDLDGKAKYTGGYVIYVKQTKCYRTQGDFYDAYKKDAKGDILKDKTTIKQGQIKYLLLDPYQDPNDPDKNIPQGAVHGGIEFKNGKGSIPGPDKNKTLWLLIENNETDYKNSAGQYNINIKVLSSEEKPKDIDMHGFIHDLFIKKLTDTSKRIFGNLVCSGGDKSSCSNFFNVIKAMLVLYIMLYGMMFSIGMIKISQLDLITRIIKVIIVSGLLNENTFNFFNEYVFDLVFKASDEIMGAIYGTQSETVDGVIKNFLNNTWQVFSRPMFLLQLSAIPGTGLAGIIIFIIVLVAIVLFLASILEFVVVYVMAKIGVIFLMSLAPIFLTCILFQTTRHLFDGWIKHLLQFIFEPIILFFGMSVITTLFLIYLDYVLGYSVCLKCSLTFNVPFISTFFPILKGLDQVPIFCIFWAAPWGYDAISTPFSSFMPHIISLSLLAYCNFKYSTLARDMCGRIFGIQMTGSAAGTVSAGLSKLASDGLKSKKDELNKGDQQKSKGGK
jgi:hypothetical protein